MSDPKHNATRSETGTAANNDDIGKQFGVAKVVSPDRGDARVQAEVLSRAESSESTPSARREGDGIEPNPTESGAAGPTPVVMFENVTKTYNAGSGNAFTAIKDVSFIVDDKPNEGEFIGILGPSGCGKSTILKLIAGLSPQHPPTSGSVCVLGKEVRGPGADRGMVFQDYTSFDHRTVLENVTFGLECHGVGRAIREELGRHWIEQVGLDVVKDAGKYPHELSGGMRQRVAIARSLAMNPDIMLFDEVTAALDPETVKEVLVTIKDLAEEGMTCMLVTHEMGFAKEIADHIYFTDRGVIVEHGPPATFFDKAEDPRTREFLSQIL